MESMNLLAAEVQTEHLAIIISVASAICTIAIGVMQLLMRQKSKECMTNTQSPECHFQHESLVAATARMEVSQKEIISTQRDISATLERVGMTLDRVAEKLDDGHR